MRNGQLMTRFRCDGCGEPVPLDDMKAEFAGGHECRYCRQCDETYNLFKSACQAENDRYERLIELFIAQARQATPLECMPQDFKPLANARGELVLG